MWDHKQLGQIRCFSVIKLSSLFKFVSIPTDAYLKLISIKLGVLLAVASERCHA